MSEESRNPNDSLDQNLNDSPPDSSVDDMGDRLERLGGEPAPAITRKSSRGCRKAGQVHIGFARTRSGLRGAAAAEAGVSLRKRRAWYASVPRLLAPQSRSGSS